MAGGGAPSSRGARARRTGGGGRPTTAREWVDAAGRSGRTEPGLRDRGPALGQQQGREFRVDQLELFEFDRNAPSHVRGWLENERLRVEQGRADYPRTPPGYVLSHGRSTPAREGYDYSNSRLQGIDLNKAEERIRREQGKP
jgi:hypothetical protein